MIGETKVRIAQFIGTIDSGGAESAVIRNIKQLRRMGHDACLVCRPSSSLIEEALRLGIEVIPLTDSLEKKWSGLKNMIPYAYEFKSFLKEHKIDVLHSHLYKAIIQNAMSCWLAGVRHVGTMHDSYTINEKPSRARWLNAAKFLKTKLTAVSQSVANSCLVSGVEVIYNGVEEVIVPSYSRKMMRTALGIEEDEIVIITTCRLIPLKRVDYLIKVVRMLKYIPISGLKLLIVGDGPMMESLVELVKETYMEDIVKFLGFRQDVPELLNASDLFVLASEDEGLSCSIIEAMFAKLPVVACDVGGNPELAKDNPGIFLVPENDIPSTMSSVLTDLIIHDTYRFSLLGSLSHDIAIKKFSLEESTKKYLDMYRKV
jgi:glycosyltransferase involved in cell wall biosynthesis